MASIASLEVAITANTAGAERGFAQTNALLNQLVANSGAATMSFGQMTGAVAAGSVAANVFMGALNKVTGSIMDMGKGALDLSSRLEQAKIGFTTMLGGAQQADGFIRKLQAFAEGTAFSFPGIQQAAQSFMAMGMDAKNVIPIIGDVSNALSAAGKGGDTEALVRVGASLSEISAQGKVTAEQLRELARNGIAVMPMLADAMGTTTAEVRKLAEEGKISATQFFEAFHSQVAQRYGNIQAEQAKTWAVAISNVGDILGRLTTETLSEFFGMLTQGALLVQDFLRSDTAQQWAADFKASIHDVMATLAPFGAAVQAAMGGGGQPRGVELGKLHGPSPAEITKVMAVPPEAVKSAEDYGGKIKAAQAEIHGITAALNGVKDQQDAVGASIDVVNKRYELQQRGLKDQQDAIGAAIDATKAKFEAQQRGLKDQQDAVSASIDATKAKYEALITPLEKTKELLGRLAEDTKADFQTILDPLKAGLEGTKQQIDDAKAGYEAMVEPIQAQIDGINKANSALQKQRQLETQIADIALRKQVQAAAGDPTARGEIARRMKLNEFAQDELGFQIDLAQMNGKKGEENKELERLQQQANGLRAEEIDLQRQALGLIDKSATAEIEKQRIINDAAKERSAIAQAEADIAANAAKAPLETQLETLKTQLASVLDPLEAQQKAFSRAIQETTAAEAAALAPIVAAQAEFGRLIEDANRELKDALAPLEAQAASITAQIKASEAEQRAALEPLEAQQKAIATAIKESEAAHRAALEPLKAQQDSLEAQTKELESQKRHLTEQTQAWKDQTTAIKEAAKESAKVAAPLDLSGGQLEPEPPPPLVGKSMIPPGMIDDFKNLAGNVQATADAFNNLNVATSGGAVGSLAELGKGLAYIGVASVAAGAIVRVGPAILGLATPAGAVTLILFGLFEVIDHLPAMQAKMGEFWDQFDTRNAEERTRDKAEWDTHYAERKQGWDSFWGGLPTAYVGFWDQFNPKTAEEQAADKAAWDTHYAQRKQGWDTFWSGLPSAYTGFWEQFDQRSAEEKATDKATWDAHYAARKQGWDGFWTDLPTAVGTFWTNFKADQTAQHAATSAAWNEFTAGISKTFGDAWNGLKGIAEAGWKTFTDWLPGAIAGVVKFFDPLLKVLQMVGDGFRQLTGGGGGGAVGGRNASYIMTSASKYGVDPKLIAALQAVENSGDTATSPAGAYGPMQVMPDKYLPGEDRGNIQTNFDAAARYIKKLVEMYGNDLDKIAGGYFGVGTDAGGMTTSRYAEILKQAYAEQVQTVQIAPASIQQISMGVTSGLAGAGVVPGGTGVATNTGSHATGVPGLSAIDIFAPLGSPIKAPVGGVSQAGFYSLGGNATIIAGDDGKYYYFAHALEPFVGGRIEAGQQIGMVGASGNAAGTPSHLHAAVSTDRSTFAVGGAGTGNVDPSFLAGTKMMQAGGMGELISLEDRLTAANGQLAASQGVVTDAQRAAAEATARSRAGLDAILTPTTAVGAANQAQAVDLQYNAQWVQTMATQQAALAQVLQGQVNPATIQTSTAMSNLSSVLGPIERQVADGSISMDTLQFKLVDLARATGLATAPWRDYDAGLIDVNEAMMRVVNQSADAGPAFEALRQQLGTTNAITDQGALSWLQLALNYQQATPAIAGAATATTAATSATGALNTATGAVNNTMDPGQYTAVTGAVTEMTGALGTATSAFGEMGSAAAGAQELLAQFDSAAHSLADFLDGHTFHVKIEVDPVPAEFMPGSPTPFEMGLRGIADAEGMLNRIHLRGLRDVEMPSSAALQQSVAERGSSAGGAPGETTTYNITVEGHLLTEDQALERIRTGLVKIARNNGGPDRLFK